MRRKPLPWRAWLRPILLGMMLAAAEAATEGPYPPEVADWDEAAKEQQRAAGRALLERIAEAVKAGQAELKVPKGDYRFAETVGKNKKTHLLLQDIQNLTIDFQGSTLWFESEASGIVLSRHENLTLKNVALDWDPLPFMQGVVTALHPEDGTFDLRLDAGYERVVPGMQGDQGKKGQWRGVVFDPSTRQLKAGVGGFCVWFDWAARNDDGTYRIKYRGFHKRKLADAGIAVGDAMAVLSRMGRAVRIEGGKGCVMEDVTLYASPFVAFAQNTGDGATFRRCQIIRRPGTNRLLGGNADGINVANAGTPPLIEGCRIQDIGDDFVNVHGHLARVIAQPSPTEVICSRMNYRGTLSEPVEVEFLNRKTLESLGRRRVTGTPVTWTIEKDNCLADLDHKWHSGEASGLAYGKKMSLQKLTLDEPIALSGDIIIACEAFSGSGAVIRNNDFEGSLARGIRLQSPRALIEGNRLARTMGPGISMFGHASFWGEGPYVHSVTARDNVLEENGLAPDNSRNAAILLAEDTDGAQPLTHDISLVGNRILRPGGAGIVARDVRGLTIEGNTVEGYAWLLAGGPASPGTGYAIVLENITGLILKDNTIDAPGAHGIGKVFTEAVSGP